MRFAAIFHHYPAAQAHEGQVDLVNRNFVATTVNQLWLVGITHERTLFSFICLKIFLDIYVCRVTHQTEATNDLIITAIVLMMTSIDLETRQLRELIYDKDKNSQCTTTPLLGAAGR